MAFEGTWLLSSSPGGIPLKQEPLWCKDRAVFAGDGILPLVSSEPGWEGFLGTWVHPGWVDSAVNFIYFSLLWLFLFWIHFCITCSAKMLKRSFVFFRKLKTQRSHKTSQCLYCDWLRTSFYISVVKKRHAKLTFMVLFFLSLLFFFFPPCQVLLGNLCILLRVFNKC